MNTKPLDILVKYYGYTSFRKGQEDIISSIINKKDVLAIMPTGGGKSICYQVPALCLDGITLVISPLISLMKDQVDALNIMGIDAAYINSSLSSTEFNEVINNIKDDKYKIIYVAPERLDSYEFNSIIKEKNISQIAIDEAHCVSSWGHDFRVSYTKIHHFIDTLYNRPVVTAFTATASQEVREDIINILKLREPDVYITGFNRENLFINIVKSSSKNKYIIDYLENHNNESGIIYVATRKDVEKIYEGLKKRGYLVSKYHAGLSKEERKQNQEDFINDKINIMIATNAFGMGIDKSNIRWVIHYNMPQSIENYYQEIGRAGRDGEASECILLFSPGDIYIQQYLIDISVENTKRKLVQHEKLQHMKDLIYSNHCYRKGVLAYFGEDSNDRCDNCSNCLSEGEVIDKTLDAQKVISCVYRMKRSFGINVIVDVLRGSKNKKILDLGFNELSTYGIMRDYSSDNLKIFINTLVSHGYLDLVKNIGYNGTFPTVKLNELSTKVLKGDIEVKFREVVVSKALNTNNELYEMLKSLRYNIAIEENIAPYMVFGDSVLKEMSSMYTTNKEEILKISGVGEIKYEKYGNKFIELIEGYITEKNINKETNIDILSNKDDEEFFFVKTDENLYKKLKELREEYAKKENTLPYRVLGNNTLKEISGRYPVNNEQLEDISGIGPIKIEKYGEDIISLVKYYILDNNINVNWIYRKKLKVVIDGESRKNNEIALDLLNQGKNINNISEDLETSISTILGYVYDYVKENKSIQFNLNLKEFYTEEEKEIILSACNVFGREKISLIKKNLPNYIKYESIRAIILEEYLENTNKKELIFE
ncbi:ATP-dependent DNA helicase recQ [uncultured Clostridium sp.]|nr:ATP-dependent DNA helicase recQ [uncultured Clostridium sp.]